MAETSHNCHKKGHYGQQCFFLSEFEEQDLDSLFLRTIINNTGGVSWKTEDQLEGKGVTFKVDTGAEATAISEGTYKDLGTITLTCP